MIQLNKKKLKLKSFTIEPFQFWHVEHAEKFIVLCVLLAFIEQTSNKKEKMLRKIRKQTISKAVYAPSIICRYPKNDMNSGFFP